MRLALVLAATVVCTQGVADNSEITGQYAMFITAEEPCSLSYDRTPVMVWLKKSGVNLNDDQFVTDLISMAALPKARIESMSGEELKAHCAMVSLAAETFGILR